MSLPTNLQVIDTMEVMFIDSLTKQSFFTGRTSKTALTQKAQAIDITSGIGGQKVSVLRSKKEIDLDVTIDKFDLTALSMMNGVKLDNTSTGTIYLNKSFAISTLSATITGATRVMAVRKLDGTFLTIVSGTPASISEVKVNGTGLTFFTGFSDTSVLVSYEGAKVNGKDNLTIVLNSKSYPTNAEVILSSVIYDDQTEAIVGDVAIDLYRVSIDPSFTWSFEIGKAIPTDVKCTVLVPELLPSGVLNTAGDMGKMIITER